MPKQFLSGDFSLRLTGLPMALKAHLKLTASFSGKRVEANGFVIGPFIIGRLRKVKD